MLIASRLGRNMSVAIAKHAIIELLLLADDHNCKSFCFRKKFYSEWLAESAPGRRIGRQSHETVQWRTLQLLRWVLCPGQGWAFCIAIYRESNILHHLKTSENIAIPEVITIFLRYFFVHDISHFWSFMDQLTNAIHQFSCVFTCVSLIGSSLLLYLICHIFVMNWHHTLHFKSATFFANKYKVGHFCRKTQNTAFLSQKIST